MSASPITEGDARVLLGRYARAQAAENAFDGDPFSAEAHRLEAETEKHRQRVIQSMVGSPWDDSWKHG